MSGMAYQQTLEITVTRWYEPTKALTSINLIVLCETLSHPYPRGRLDAKMFPKKSVNKTPIPLSGFLRLLTTKILELNPQVY